MMSLEEFEELRGAVAGLEEISVDEALCIMEECGESKYGDKSDD